ncbi:uncharacterized protein [Drosophila takahashii]|uniref:uncharacterized protein n=1 Tax=Drosophila takahashii TaxID=29030 RepID=UPI0038993189
MNKNKKPQPLFKVELEPDSRTLKKNTVHPIYKLQYLLHLRITVEEPHKRNGPVQCTNCQEYGHTRGYCTLRLTSHRTNWLKFKKYVSSHIDLTPQLNIKEDIDCYADALESVLVAAAKISTPQGRDGRTHQHKINLEIEQLVLEKRRLRRAWQTSRSPSSKQSLKEAGRRLTRALRHEEVEAQRQYIEKLSPTSAKHPLWKAHPNLSAPSETAFDRVWLDGLMHKIRTILPENTHMILESYLFNREFAVRCNTTTSDDYTIEAGVPQGSALGPTLFLLYTADIPTNVRLTTSTFADDTGIISLSKCPIQATALLADHLVVVERQTCPPLTLNNTPLPQADDVTYLGVHLDRRLTWRKHIEAKKIHLKLKSIGLHWLLNARSPLCLDFKVLLYN